MKGYVHDIKLDDGNDGETIKVIAKCYRSYKKSETPNKLLMDIDIENKVITDVIMQSRMQVYVNWEVLLRKWFTCTQLYTVSKFPSR